MASRSLIRTAILSHSLRRDSLFGNYAKPIPQRSIRHPEFLSMGCGAFFRYPFYGYNDVMGNTREVWFIRDGFLYESYKELEPWLAEIMSTWKFL